MALSTSTLSLAPAPPSQQQLLIVCDGASPDLFPLLRGGRHPLHTIAACTDPIEAITQRLHQAADAAGFEELHVVAHGRSGAFYLGGHWIDRAGLVAAATSLAGWNVARIILWSCHTGADPAFLATLAELTGATVHASANRLGFADALTINSQGRIGTRFAFADLFAPAAIEAWGGSLNGPVVVDSGGLVFANGIKVTSNSRNPVGTTYLYQDVYVDAMGQRVDALITVTGVTNAIVSAFDSNSLQFDAPDLFQPNVTILNSTNQVGGSAEFHFQFIQGGSYSGGTGIPVSAVTVASDELIINGATPYAKVSLENVSFTAYDIDGQSGNPTAKQFVQIQKYDPQSIVAGTAVDVSEGAVLRFSAKTTGDSDPNGPVFDVAEFVAHSATAGIGIVDSFNLTVGDFSNTSATYLALYGISFGPAVPASLGDFLWNDSNGNGLQDTGELGIAGKTVTLIGGGIDGVIGTADDTSVTTTTDGSGKYLFSRLTAGIEYQVIFGDIPTGTVFTTPNVSGIGFDAIDSDADPSTGKTQILTLAQGENNISLDAGLYTPAKISGYVYQDIGNDGVRNNEPPIAGVSLQLTGLDGVGNSVTATTTTNASGYYEFTGLRPGTYTISETQPVNYIDGKDTAGTPGGGSAGNDVISDIVLTSGMSSTENNFGERLLGISGYKFIDIVGDGVWGPVNPLEPDGERDPGEQGWRINLSRDTNLDGKLSDGDALIASDVTDATGQYQFENLGPLDLGEVYIVWESPVPVGSFDTSVDWSRTFNTTGYYTLDPILGQSIAGVEGSSDLGLDGEGPGKGNFGNFKNLDLGCYKWLDTNGNAIWDSGETGSNGWKIYLDDNENLDDGYIRMETTKNDGTYDGFYEFQNITPDEIDGATTLYVYEEIRPGYIKTFGGYTFDVQNGQIVSSQYGIAQIGNFGNFEIPSASLGDFLWNDSNGNGVQDSGELGVSGQTVTLIGGGADGLINGIGDTTSTTTTDGDGSYSFTGLTPGEYQVQFSKPTGTVFTGKDQGGNDDLDSDADTVTGKTQVVTLSSGVNNTTLDAGVYTPASLGDFLWNDSNGNGVQDSGELGVPDQTVTLIGGGADGLINGIGDTTSTTTTAGDGSYSFSGLTPGEYQVQFSKPTGTVFTGKDQGGNDALDSDVNASGLSQIVTLVSGKNNTSVDAGLISDSGDLRITKNDGLSVVFAGQSITYSIVVSNTGTATATNAVVKDVIPSNLTNVTWTSTAAGGATGNQTSGSGNIDDEVTLPPGSTITYSLTGTVVGTTTLGSLTSFDFAGNSSTSGVAGNTRTFAKDGITVTASAFSRLNGLNGAWSKAYLGSYGYGLGVTDSSEGSGGNNSHLVDNVGVSDNYVVFRFSQSVVLDKALLQYVQGDSDLSVWIGNTASPVTSLSDVSLSSLGFYEVNDTNLSTDRWADLNAGQLAGNTVVIAASTTGNNDRFKLRSLQVNKLVQVSGTLTNTATVTPPGGFTDTNPNNNSATDTDVISAAPGARTPGFWQNTKWRQFWDGNETNQNALPQNGTATFPKGDLLFAPYVNSSRPGQVVDPVTGVYSTGLLIGDFNRNGVTDTGEDTLFYSTSEALRILDPSQNPDVSDVRYTLARNVAAAWLNHLAGNPLDTAATNDKDARYYLREGVNWLQALSPDENAFSDGKGDGSLSGLNVGVNSPRILASTSFWSGPGAITSAASLPTAYRDNTSVDYPIDPGNVISTALDSYNNGLSGADGLFYGGAA